jgi:hypothetical protein
VSEANRLLFYRTYNEERIIVKQITMCREQAHFAACFRILPLLEQSFCLRVKRPYSRLRGNDKERRAGMISIKSGGNYKETGAGMARRKAPE